MSLLADNHPGFFEVLATPRAYTTLAYLLLSMPLGILTFTFAVTGLSLSLGLAILIIGIPFTLAFLALTRVMSVAEIRLLKTMVDPEGLDAPAFLPLGDGWMNQLKSLVTDRHTWTSLGYFLLQLPLGIASFTVLITSLIVGLAMIVAPLAALLHRTVEVSFEGLHPLWFQSHPGFALMLCAFTGIVLVPLTFHAALVLGRLQTWLARHLLVRE